MKRKNVYYIVFTLFCVAFASSAFMLALELMHRETAQSDLKALAGYADMTPEKDLPSDMSAQDEDLPEIKRNIKGLNERNPDCIGWIYIEDTAVDYPVMHTPDEPQKYLHRDFELEYSAAGIPFLDYGCSLDSDNLIIYGHNMKNGTMFADLIKYLEPDFRKEHSRIEFESMEGCCGYTVTDVRIVHKTDPWYGRLDSADNREYLTLSTCYGPDNDSRLIIIAVKNDNNDSIVNR